MAKSDNKSPKCTYGGGGIAAPPATNNFYRAWRSPKKVLMQKSQKFCADFKYVNLKIELLQIFEKKSFSSLFLMRKPLSSDQKWFLRPYFPLIGGIFVLKSGLRFLFWALEVPIRKVRKRPFFTLKPYYHLPISKKIHRDTFFFSQSMLLPLVLEHLHCV